jgi:hypothetical protein
VSDSSGPRSFPCHLLSSFNEQARLVEVFLCGLMWLLEMSST